MAGLEEHQWVPAGSLRRLGIDVSQDHVWWDENTEVFTATLKRLKEQCKVRFLGLSANDHDYVRHFDHAIDGMDTLQLERPRFRGNSLAGIVGSASPHWRSLYTRSIPFGRRVYVLAIVAACVRSSTSSSQLITLLVFANAAAR